MAENGWQFKCTTSSIHKKGKKISYGTNNQLKKAKTRVQVVADIQKFALCAHCGLNIPQNQKHANTCSTHALYYS